MNDNYVLCDFRKHCLILPLLYWLECASDLLPQWRWVTDNHKTSVLMIMPDYFPCCVWDGQLSSSTGICLACPHILGVGWWQDDLWWSWLGRLCWFNPVHVSHVLAGCPIPTAKAISDKQKHKSDFFRPLLVMYWLIFHWPKQIM